MLDLVVPWSSAIACVLLLVFLPTLSGVSGNSEQKTILQTIKQLIQYTVLEIQLLLLGYAKIWATFPTQLIRRQELCWCKQPTSNNFQTLQTVYTYSNCTIIFILLGNVLANICSEVTKIWLILWMVYTCNVKGLEEVEKLGRNECTLHRWPRSPVMSDCSRPYQ